MKDKKTRTQERIEKRNESYNDYVEQIGRASCRERV